MSSKNCRTVVLLALTTSMAPFARVNAQASPTAGATSSIPITVFGELRTRSEWNSATSANPADAFTYLRGRFGVRADPVPGARVVLQVQDSRVLGAESNASPAALAADVFDLHQGYLELFNLSGPTAATFRVGRQEIALGNERLVGVSNWTNLARSFDGARLIVGPRVEDGAAAAPWSATLAAATVEERGPRFGAQPSTPTRDHFMSALYAVHSLPWDGSIDGTILYDRGGRYRAYDDATRTTLDSHFKMRFGSLPLRAELEGAVQRGRQIVTESTQSQTVDAWLAAARLAITPIGRRHFVAGLGADVLSGDDDPLDGRFSAFSTMYPSNHSYYGLMDVIGDPATTTKDRGLVDAFATGSSDLTTRTSLKVEVHHFDMRAGEPKPLGWETDVILPIRLSRAATIELGYGLFRASDGAESIGLVEAGHTRNWLYAQFGVGF